MKKTSGYSLARSILDKNGYKDWDLAYANMTYCTGVCIHEAKVFLLASWLLHSNNVDAIADTMAHEIAHAKTKGDGHGSKWQKAYYDLTGRQYCKPSSLLYIIDVMPKPSKLGICENNNTTISYDVMPLTCDLCNKKPKQIKIKQAWRRQVKSLLK